MKFSIVKNRSKIYMRNLYDHRIYATVNIILEKKTIISSLFQSFQNQLPNKKAKEKLEKTKVQ